MLIVVVVVVVVFLVVTQWICVLTGFVQCCMLSSAKKVHSL